MNRFLLAASLVAASAAAAVQAQAPVPGRTVSMVVGFAPGGGTDTAARIIAKKVAENTGQQIVVENKPGAGGNIATELAAKAAPDGATILLATVGSLAVNPHMVAKMPYDALRDLAPVTMAVVFPNVLVVNASVPAATLAEFVKLAQSKPGGLTYGSSGIGGAGHLAGELFRSMAKVELTHVPYKGGGPATTDLLGGQIPAIFSTPSSVVGHIKAGRIRALATTGAQRALAMPEVPTVAEQGYPGYEATNWYAYVVPARTPKDVIARWNRELVKALAAPDVRQQLLVDHGMEPQPGSAEALGRFIEKEYAVWGRVVKEAKITAN